MGRARILVLMHYLEVGGAETALIGLLHALDPQRVDVDLFLYSHQGELMELIPQWVNVLPEIGAYSVIERPIGEALRRGHPGVALGRWLARRDYVRYRRREPVSDGRQDVALMQYVGDRVTPRLPRINPDVEYELCISFLTPHNIGLHKVRAKKRLAWIHTDYSRVSINAARELEVWGAYDHIASISPAVTQAFLSQMPPLEPKIVEIENVLSEDLIRRRAEAFDALAEMPGEVRLLSVGRFEAAKNFDNVPDIARRLVDMGVHGLRWYIVGYGGWEELIRQQIARAGMERHVILLGKKTNPYPYIKACDIYVQPSRFEGKSVAVREAQILCKPVVVTNFPTASSQIVDGVDGVIVPLDNAACAQGLAAVIRDRALQHAIAENLRRGDYSNESEAEKLYKLIEEDV